MSFPFLLYALGGVQIWSQWVQHIARWKFLAFFVGIHAGLLLEVLDFPPFLELFDAHSLWHAYTPPFVYMWYRWDPVEVFVKQELHRTSTQNVNCGLVCKLCVIPSSLLGWAMEHTWSRHDIVQDDKWWMSTSICIDGHANMSGGLGGRRQLCLRGPAVKLWLG